MKTLRTTEMAREGERGATMVEYAIMVALILVTAITSTRSLGNSVTETLDRTSGCLSGLSCVGGTSAGSGSGNGSGGGSTPPF